MDLSTFMHLISLSNLGDGKVQPSVNDEGQEQEEKGDNAQQRLLEHNHSRKCITELKFNVATQLIFARWRSWI